MQYVVMYDYCMTGEECQSWSQTSLEARRAHKPHMLTLAFCQFSKHTTNTQLQNVLDLDIFTFVDFPPHCSVSQCGLDQPVQRSVYKILDIRTCHMLQNIPQYIYSLCTTNRMKTNSRLHKHNLKSIALQCSLHSVPHCESMVWTKPIEKLQNVKLHRYTSMQCSVLSTH